jgi:hypothetical protein
VSEQEMEAPVAVFRHSLTVYREMEQQGKVVKVEDTSMLVYEGKLVELVTDTCDLSIPYYTKVTKALKGMGCARQLRRGGGNSPSQWELITEPTPELFDLYINDVPVEEEPEEVASMQMPRDMNKRMTRIERALGL